MADARQLAGHATEAPSASADANAATSGDLYLTLGCAGCHANERIAPALTDLLGAQRRLSHGAKLVVDEAYLRRSILEPGAQVVAGYSPVMPSYAEFSRRPSCAANEYVLACGDVSERHV